MTNVRSASVTLTRLVCSLKDSLKSVSGCLNSSCRLDGPPQKHATQFSVIILFIVMYLEEYCNDQS